MQMLQEVLAGVTGVAIGIAMLAVVVLLILRRGQRGSVARLLKRHFFPTSLDQITVTERQFPTHIRADLQSAVDEFLRDVTVCSFHGVQCQVNGLGGVDFTSLLDESPINFSGSTRPGPPQYELIVQAIEFPLPDQEGREKLVQLYSRGIQVADGVVESIAKRTEKVSASFIKELMRRAAQFHLDRDGTQMLNLDDVDKALEEMLFSGPSDCTHSTLTARAWLYGRAALPQRRHLFGRHNTRGRALPDVVTSVELHGEVV